MTHLILPVANGKRNRRAAWRGERGEEREGRKEKVEEGEDEYETEKGDYSGED